MSLNISGLIDRVYREYLEPMDDVTSYTTLFTGVTDSETTITFAGELLTQEEKDAMDAGTIIECDTELMRCVSLDTVNNSVVVVRGVRGTDKAAHLAGAVIKIAPPFPRQVVFDAIKDQINNLFPTLFAVDTQSITTGTGYTLIGDYSSPGTHNYIVSILSAISQYTDFSVGSDTTGINFNPVTSSLVELPNPFTYTDADGVSRTITYSTGPSVVHAIQFAGISSGHTAHVTFKKKFIAPTAEANTLVSIGLEEEYEPIVMTGVAAQLVAGKDISKLNTSYITEQLETSVNPVGNSNSIGQGLLRYQQLLIQQARSNLRSKYPEPVQLNSILYPT